MTARRLVLRRNIRSAEVPATGHRLMESKRFRIGALIVGSAVLMAILAPAIVPYAPGEQTLRDRLLPPGSIGESGLHVFGTDRLGRDVLSRTIYGAQISLALSFASVGLALFFGIPAGLVAGYWRGFVSDLIMALVEVLTTFPYILLAIAFVAVLGPDIFNLAVVLSIRGWPLFTRLVEMEVRSLRGYDYIEAARSIGCRHIRILTRHLLPAVVGMLIVVATVELARVILIEAALSFLGLGVPPGIPTWGGMLSDGRDYIERAWWLSVVPGIAIVVVALGINLLGDGLREHMDPLVRLPHETKVQGGS